MHERWIRLIKILYDAGDYVSIKQLASQLEVSAKTIKTLFEQHAFLNAEFGIMISNAFGMGYKVIVKDEHKFSNLMAQQDVTTNETMSRIQYMITSLLQKDDYQRIEDFADALHVSRATIDRLMPELKEIVQAYDLEVTVRPKYGIRIDGNEKNKRLCCAHHSKQRKLESDEALVDTVQKILLESIRKHGLLLNDINFYNLVVHCVVAIRRISSGNHMNEVQAFNFQESIDKEDAAAQEIVERFEEAFQIQITNGEKQYIVMHLLGKRVLERFDTISAEVFQCVEDIFAEIYSKKSIDLSQDGELRTALALHVQPLISRLEYGLKQDNPILWEIKRDMNPGYELALCAAEIIAKNFNLTVNEDEAGYLALHFTVALDRRHENATQKKIVVVCASGRGIAKIIQHRLINRFGFKADNLIITSSLLLEELDFADVLCILTTIPLQKDYAVPMVLVDLTMNEQSLNRVDRLLGWVKAPYELDHLLKEELIFQHRDFSTRDEILTFMSHRVREHYKLTDDFLDNVLKRESLSSTEVGNLVALPHPYVYEGSEVILSFLTLKRPIRWKFGLVQFIVLIGLPAGHAEAVSNQINDAIMQLVNDKEAIQYLISDMNRMTLHKILFKE